MMEQPQGTTVVLADDHHIVREGFAALCAANGMEVIGQCSEGPEALEMILELRPDFAILDLHMPGMTGVEVIRRLRGRGCLAKLPILFVKDGGQYVSPLLRGAGLFTKPERSVPDDPMASLSRREIEVFTYLVKGMRAKDIAELLRISPKTVDTYRASLMRKLNVHDIVGLVKFAIERNLTSTSEGN